MLRFLTTRSTVGTTPTVVPSLPVAAKSNCAHFYRVIKSVILPYQGLHQDQNHSSSAGNTTGQTVFRDVCRIVAGRASLHRTHASGLWYRVKHWLKIDKFKYSAVPVSCSMSLTRSQDLASWFMPKHSSSHHVVTVPVLDAKIYCSA